MKKSALDKAAMRLQENPYILARFKRNPRSALAQYQLADDDVAALQRGDTMELIGRGLDWRIPFARPISRPLFSSILMTNAGKMAPALFAGLVLALWPTLASADQTLAARRLRFLSDNPRISRRRDSWLSGMVSRACSTFG